MQGLRALVIAVLAGMVMAPSPPLIMGLDHVPVAVHDLDAAARDFARLGFVIKPGRVHDDGIRNRHVKFPNGGGIELITAAAPTDALARDYADWLQGPDGPAYWSVFAPRLPALAAFLAGIGLRPNDRGDVVNYGADGPGHTLFFADRLRSPNDGPAYWAHPNTAYRLGRVWLAGAAGEAALLRRLGAVPAGRACAPFDPRARVLALPGEGDQVAVTARVDRGAAREIVGMTVLVHDVAAARRVLAANGVAVVSPAGCRGALWVAPAEAHGAWLEFAGRL